MAIYSFHVGIVTRSKANTVEALAYRSGVSLTCPRTGETFSAPDRPVQHVDLLVPHDAPSWAHDLQSLVATDRPKGIQAFCDLAERAEKRKDAQLYREWRITLPLELTQEQQIALAREFVQDQACGLGMTALLNFHFDRDDETGHENPHCHVLLLTRRLTESGLSAEKETAWNDKALLKKWREQWAAYANFHLKLHGHDVQIDHRSYVDQGIDLLPQPKMGRGFKEQEARSGGKSFARRVQFDRVRHQNVAKLIARPETVFDVVTRQQSTFLWGDVEKVLARYVWDQALFESLSAKLRASSDLVLLREETRVTADGVPEDVCIYTTQRMLKEELALVAMAERLGARQTHGTSDAHRTAALARSPLQLYEDQEAALMHVTRADQVSCLMGYAGSGKSTLFKVAKDVWETAGYKVYGLAPTGRAAQNLEAIGIPSQTLHKFLWEYDHGRCQYGRRSVLILDEAGLVDVARLTTFLHAADRLGVKVVLSGDGAQAQPIEAGPAFRLVTDRVDAHQMHTVIRQKIDWQVEATQLFGTYRTQEALEHYLDRGHVQFMEEKIPDLNTLVAEKRFGEVVTLYNLSRRLTGNIWHSILEDLKQSGVPSDQLLSGAASHEDFGLFRERQALRNACAREMAGDLDTYRPLMKAKGVDPVSFAALFLEKDLAPEERTQEIRRLVAAWKLAWPDEKTPAHACDSRSETRKALVSAWSQSLAAHPDETHLMVAHTLRDVSLLNEEARFLRRSAGHLAAEEFIHTVTRESSDDFGRKESRHSRKAFAVGDRLVFRKGDGGLQVKNGTLGTVQGVTAHTLKVKIDGEDRVVSFASKVYPYFDHGWALTLITAQGSGADRVFKLANFEEDRNLSYVGMTRHKKDLRVFGSTLDFWREEIFVSRLSQSREKLAALDYLSPEEAANRLKPSPILTAALDRLGNRLESWGYTTRTAWDGICTHFLGRPAPQKDILIPEDTLAEAVRARDLGIRPGSRVPEPSENLPAVVVSSDPVSTAEPQNDSDRSAEEQPLSPPLSLPTRPFYAVEDVRQRLTRGSVTALCTTLFGPPSPRLSTARQLRYGSSGSLCISLSGKTLGQWKDFARDEGGDLFKLVQRERNLTFPEAVTWVAEHVHARPVARHTTVARQQETPSANDDLVRRLQKVEKLVDASRPVTGTLAERYLQDHRGIHQPLPDDLRFIPSVWHSGAKKSLPALAALARTPDGTVTALQVIYLDEKTGAKAAVDLKKQSFGLVKGSLVCLQKGDGPVFVAEGVETALSLKEAGLTGSVYAALGIANFRNVSTFFPDTRQPLVLCADQDGEGSPAHTVVDKAVATLKEAGYSVSLIRPSAENGKDDFNDVLKRDGVAGVRRYFEAFLIQKEEPHKQHPEPVTKESAPTPAPASEKMTAPHQKAPDFSLRPPLEEYHRMVLANRVHTCLRLILKKDLLSASDDALKSRFLGRLELVSAFKDVRVFETAAVKPSCQAFLLEEKWKGYLLRKGDFSPFPLGRKWAAEAQVDRLSLLMGRLSYEQFFAQGKEPDVIQQEKLYVQAIALDQERQKGEESRTQTILNQGGVSPEGAFQAARQITRLSDQTGQAVPSSVQHEIIQLCQEAVTRLNAYKIHVPLVPGARAECDARVCQSIVETFLRERARPSPETLQKLECQTLTRVLDEQQKVLNVQRSSQKTLTPERSGPSRGFGMEL